MEHTEYTIDWSEINLEFNYVAIDPDGEMWGFEYKPVFDKAAKVWYFGDTLDGLYKFGFIEGVAKPVNSELCIYKRPAA